MQQQSEMQSSTVSYQFRHNPYDEVIARWYYGANQEAEGGEVAVADFPTSTPLDATSDECYDTSAAYESQGWVESSYGYRTSSSAFYHQQQEGEEWYYPEDENGSSGCYDPSLAPHHSISQETSHLSSQYCTSNSSSSATGIETVLCPGEPLPENTIHSILEGSLDFVTYPTVAFENLEPTLPKSEMVCLFIGQLPRATTAMQLGWLAYTFGQGANLYHMEQIPKKIYFSKKARLQGRPSRVELTGCYHAWCTSEDAEKFTAGVHGRALIDDTGVWYCGGGSTAVQRQKEQLQSYCDFLPSGALPEDRPYRPVVVQPAISPHSAEDKLSRNNNNHDDDDSDEEEDEE